MNLIAGATGTLGAEVCRLLAEQGQAVRALVRSTSAPEKVARLKGVGAEPVVGDLKERASLDAACRGVSAVLSTASSTHSRQEGDSIDSVDLQGQLNDRCPVVPADALRAQHAAATDSLQQSFAGLMLYYARGDVIDTAEALRRLPVGQLTSVRDYFRGATTAAP